MSDFKKINPSDINESIFDLIGKDWALVTREIPINLTQ